MKIVKKKWGQETWMVNDKYCMKMLRVEPEHFCSLHYHPIKDETFFFLSNDIELEVGDSRFWPRKFDHVRIAPKVIHRFYNGGGETALILECSTHHDDEDVVRLEESQ